MLGGILIAVVLVVVIPVAVMMSGTWSWRPRSVGRSRRTPRQRHEGSELIALNR